MSEFVQFWLGINDDVKEGSWHYTGSDVTVSYALWAPNEPNGIHMLDGDGRQSYTNIFVVTVIVHSF